MCTWKPNEANAKHDRIHTQALGESGPKMDVTNQCGRALEPTTSHYSTILAHRTSDHRTTGPPDHRLHIRCNFCHPCCFFPQQCLTFNFHNTCFSADLNYMFSVSVFSCNIFFYMFSVTVLSKISDVFSDIVVPQKVIVVSSTPMFSIPECCSSPSNSC